MSSNVPFELTVSGKAVIPHHAERALIHVNVASTSTNKASVVDEVVTTAKHIESMLREFSPVDETEEAKVAAPLAHWNKNSLSSTSWMPRDHRGIEQGPMKYKATVSFDIRFKEFKALGSFGTRVSAIPHVEVQDIDWYVMPATEEKYRPQLRRDSAADAMRKAKDYCDVLGCTNLRPVELNESDQYSSSSGSYRRVGHQRMMRQQMQMQQQMQTAPGYGPNDDDDQTPDEFEFRPQEVKMTKDITIKFHADAISGGIDVTMM